MKQDFFLCSCLITTLNFRLFLSAKFIHIVDDVLYFSCAIDYFSILGQRTVPTVFADKAADLGADLEKITIGTMG